MCDEQKQIEEMAKVIEITEQVARDAHCGLPSPTMYAKDLYWKGYRKQSEIIDAFTERIKERLFTIPAVYNSHFGRMIDAVAKEMKGE